MVGKNNVKKRLEKKGEKIETYSIKKFKVGAASVLIGVGLFFGAGVVEASDNATVQQSDNKKLADSKELDAPATATVEVKPVEKKTENTREKVVEAVAEKLNPQTAEKTQQEVDKSLLLQKIRELKAQLERIKNNSSQQSMINDATSKLAAAETLVQTSATQQEVNAKAKEISSLTTILKSMKAEETVKENKNQDSRNGKKMQEGTGFREGGAAGTGVGADVVDATSTPAVARGEYTKREDAEAFTKQVTWLDFGDVAHWENIDNEGGKIYLKEGSKYSKEVIPGYIINIKVKSLKPFQATEIYRKRMEAANASEEEKATFNPNATNQHFGEGSGPSRVTADQQDGEWSEVRNNGINTGNKKTAIGAGTWSNIGVQFEISATYKEKNVRPAVIMNDSESANHGENIILTTNGSPWERVLELKKERFVGGTFTPTPYKPINNYNLRHEDYPQSGGQNNANQLLGAMRDGLLTLTDGTKFAPKYMTNPDQEMGGLGTGVFGPVTSSGGYSLPILMTKDATEVGLYILSSGIQTAMMGVIPIDEGDAPESYGKASHTINTVNGVTGDEVKQPYLGSTRPDMDTGTTKDWYGDDKDSDADEGINQLLPDNLKDSEGNIIKANISKKGYYKLNVQAHTGGAEKAYIRSWIDFNNNGKFDEDEGSEIAEITKDGEVSLEFKTKTSKDAGDLLEAGTRVRIATNKSDIEKPTGNAFSGEVEDFKTKITHPPKGEKKETVGNIKETQKEEIHFTVSDGKKNVYVDGNPAVEIDKTVAPVYFDNKTGQQVTLTSDNTYTVEGEGTYKFIVAENGIDVKVEFTPADGFIGKAHGVSIRRQDTNKTTTDWGNFDTTKDPNINNILDSMDGLYIPEVTPPAEVVTSVNNAESKNIQGLPQKGQPTFNVETAKDPVTPSAKYPAKLVDPATGTVTTATTVNALEQGTNKVIGTYTIVPETGEVTFTPNKDFKGVPAPVTVSAEVELSHDKDGNITKKTLTGTYTPTIIPVVPTSENAKSEGIQGATQEGTPVFKPGKANVGTEENPVEKTVPLTISATNPAKFVVDGQPVEETTIPAKEGDKEVGTYTIDPATGKVTFTPNKDYHGTPTPVTVQAKDDNGTPATATYSPVVKPAVPTADKQKTTDVQGAKQTATPVFTPGKNTVNNEEVEVPFEPTSKAKLIDPSKTGEEAEVTSLEVPNQGTYTIDDNGVVTFTPLPTFTGEATPVSIVRKDKNGTPATATYTPKVVGVTPKGENVNTEGIQGATQEGTPVFKPGKVNVGTEENPVEKTVPLTISATNPAKFVVDGQPVETTTIPAKEGDKEVGTYTIDPATGKVTFTPNKDYHGTPTPVTVQAKDDNGTPATATYSPVVKPAVPTADKQKTTDVQGAKQTATPVFTPGKNTVNNEEVEVPFEPTSKAKLIDPSKTGEEAEVTSLEVPNQGTYTIDDNGVVTFTPLPTFTGEATPVSIVRKDKNGTPATATYTPKVVGVTPKGENVNTEGIQGATQEGTPVFKPGKVNVGTEENPVEKTVPLTISATNPAKFVVDGQPVETTTIPAKEGDKEVGTYTIDPATGKVTFTPNKDYSGTPTPVTVQAKDDNGTPATATYSPVVKPAVPTADKQKTTDVQGAKQTATPVFTPGKNTVNNEEVEVPFEPTSKAKLIDPSKTGEEAEVTSLEVPNQGTYTIDDNGVVTFTPLPTFTGEATPVSIVRKDKNGTPATATYTPKVVGVTPKGENVNTEGIQGATQEGTPVFKPGKVNVGTEENPVEKTVPITISATNPAKFVVDGQPVETTTIPAKEGDKEVGTYTIDPATGKVTFTPNKDYSGTPTPVTVQAKDDNGTPATATYSPVVKPAVPTADKQKTTDVQGAKQTATPVFTPGKNTVNNEEVEVPFEPTSKAKLIDPSKTGEEAEVTSLEVPNQGTYTIDDNGVVTFTPLPTFTGEATPVSIVRKDKNGTPATATYTPKVVGVTPKGENVNTEGIQGATQEGTPVFKAGKVNVGTEENPVEKTVPITISATNPAKFIVDGQPVEETTIPAKEGDKQVGTYTIEPATGKVTFTPNKDYHGTPTPVTVQAKDDNGTPATATYSPTVTPVTPEGTPAETTGIQGATQEGTPTFKPGNPNVPINEEVAPTLEGANPEGKVVVPGEGTYTVDKDGKVTFTPEPQFTGTAKGVTVKRVDKNGTSVTAKYTPTVTPVTPEGTPAETTGIQGATQEGTPTFKPGNPNVPINEEVAPTLEGANPEGKVVVPGEGTYTVDKDGKVTFTPEPQFTGTAKGVTVKRVDKNGTSVTAKYTPTVTPVTPEGTPAETTGIQGATQEGTPTFKPGNPNVPINEEVAPTLEGANPEGKVVVPGEGTYTVDKDGKVTFTPEPQFTGTAKGVTVKRVDKNGTPVTAKYTPTVTPVTPEGTPAETTGIQGATQEGTPTFKPGNSEVPITITDEQPAQFVVDGTPVTEKEIPAKDKDGKVVGKYTVNPKSGKVTFTPNKDFTGTPVPATVQVKDSNGTPATATYTPTVTPVTPTAEPKETTDIQGKEQTGKPTFKPGNPEVPIDDEVPATFEDGLTEKVVPGEGTYKVNPDGTVTFTPEKGFTGTGTGVTVKRVDKNGTPVTVKYTPTVTPVTPTGEVSETEGDRGAVQKSPVVFDTPDQDNTTVNFNKGHEKVALDKSTLTLVDKAGKEVKEVKVPGEGTYLLKDGVIEFTPEKDFVGKASGVTVQVKDENGKVVSKTYTPTVRPDTKFVVVGKDGKETELIPSKDGEKSSESVPGYKVVKTVKDKDGNTKHIYEKVTTSFKDKEGKEIPNYPTEEGTTPKKDNIPGYRFVETKKLPNGDTEHVYEKVTTSYKDKEGNVIPNYPTEVGEQPNKAIPGYKFVTTNKLPNGDTEHVYEKVTTSYKDKEGNVIPGNPTEAGEQPNKAIPGYKFVTTNKLLNGDTEHVYEKVTTSYKDKEGNVIPGNPTEAGEQPNKAIPGYKFVETKKLPNGDTEHVYEKVTTSYKDKEGNVIPNYPTEVGEQPNKAIPGYKFVTTNKLPNGDTEHVYEKVTTSYKDKEGNVIPGYPTEVGEQPNKVIPGYKFVETKKLPNGDTEHVYEKVTTSYKDKEGNVIPGNPTEEGEQPNKAIPGYKFVETKKLPNGNIEHVYEKVTTEKGIIRDKEGNPIPGYEFDRMSPILDIPEYVYVETVTDPDGTVRHIYRPVETVHKDKNGNSIPNVPTKEKGTKGNKEIPGYRLVETKKLPNGDVEHVYEKVKGTTTWVDEYGNVLIPKEEGILDPSKVSGYEFVRTDVDKEGNIRHVFKKISINSSPVVSATTSWIDEEGNPLKVTENGTRKHGVIPGYEHVRTVTDENGNVRHIFRKVTPVEEKVQVKHLANTGTTETNTGLAGLGLAVLGGLLAATKRRKDK